MHGLVAQKRRAGVLATAGARAWPKVQRAPGDKPQLRASKVVFVPLLIPQPDRERYQFFSVYTCGTMSFIMKKHLIVKSSLLIMSPFKLIIGTMSQQ